ncbi:unnamed protein product [Parajaminaea phylloscopi]
MKGPKRLDRRRVHGDGDGPLSSPIAHANRGASSSQSARALPLQIACELQEQLRKVCCIRLPLPSLLQLAWDILFVLLGLRPGCLVDCFSPTAHSVDVLCSVLERHAPDFAQAAVAAERTLAVVLFGPPSAREEAEQELTSTDGPEQLQCFVVNSAAVATRCTALLSAPRLPAADADPKCRSRLPLLIDARPASPVGAALSAAPSSLLALAATLRDGLVTEGQEAADRRSKRGNECRDYFHGVTQRVHLTAPLIHGVAFAGWLLGYPALYCLDEAAAAHPADDDDEGGIGNGNGSANNLADAPLRLFRISLHSQPAAANRQRDESVVLMAFSVPETALRQATDGEPTDAHDANTRSAQLGHEERAEAQQIVGQIKTGLERSIDRLKVDTERGAVEKESDAVWEFVESLSTMRAQVAMETVQLSQVGL